VAEPFLAELRLMSFNWAPQGWAMANGQMLPINQNQPLFALLGTTYGGNGQTTFALPDLRGRVPIHVGAGHTLGERGGEQAHTVSVAEMPQHLHLAQASSLDGTDKVPGGKLLGQASLVYSTPAALTAIEPSTITNAGGSQAHSNMQPYLTLTWCIALIGIFPSPN
jgi:microcystin-dependent protein